MGCSNEQLVFWNEQHSVDEKWHPVVPAGLLVVLPEHLSDDCRLNRVEFVSIAMDGEA